VPLLQPHHEQVFSGEADPRAVCAKPRHGAARPQPSTNGANQPGCKRTIEGSSDTRIHAAPRFCRIVTAAEVQPAMRIRERPYLGRVVFAANRERVSPFQQRAQVATCPHRAHRRALAHQTGPTHSPGSAARLQKRRLQIRRDISASAQPSQRLQLRACDYAVIHSAKPISPGSIPAPAHAAAWPFALAAKRTRIQRGRGPKMACDP